LAAALCAIGVAQSQSPSEVLKQSQQAEPRAAHSAAAVKLLRHVDEARRVLANGDQQQALAHVDTALMIIEQFGDRASVPIYTELEQVSFTGPIEAAKRGVKERVASEPSPVNHAPTVQLTVGEYTRVSLDVRQARTHLLAAKAALNDRQTAQADAALLAVQSGVTLESVATNLPLVRARQNLALALERARASQSETVTDALKAAADALNNYALTTDAQRVGEVNTLRAEIMAYLQQSQANQGNRVERINAWWDRVADWLDEPPQLTQK
jgi:hypothetical protein